MHIAVIACSNRRGRLAMACSVVRLRVDDGPLLAKKRKRNTAGLPPIQHAAAIPRSKTKPTRGLQKAIKEMRPVLSQFESGITHAQKARLGSVVDVSADVTSTVHQLSINELSAWTQKRPV